MSTGSGSEGRGETTGPAGSRADSRVAVEKTRGRKRRRGTTMSSETQVLTSYPVPVVYRLSFKKKRGRKKYSDGLKEVQKLELGLTNASRRLSDAVERGLTTYRRRRNKSARRKKDGAIRDGIENISIGFGRFLRVASDAPYDVTRKINTRRFSRNVRDTMRLLVPPIFR